MSPSPTPSDPDEGVHPLTHRIEHLAYEGDSETAKKLRREAERTLGYQLEALHDIDPKAMAILRTNVVFIGLILTLFALATDVRDDVAITAFLNGYVAAGIVSLLISSMVAAATYTASDIEVGFS